MPLMHRTQSKECLV
jgi:hypothetical protein